MKRFSAPGWILLLLVFGVASLVLAAPPQQENLFQLFVQNIREDMEVLADRVFGGGQRPDVWTGNTELASPSYLADLWFDNEQLADEIFGPGVRPEGWISATTDDARLLARNIRHDLELAASEILGDLRPDAWNGAPAINTCDRTLQNTVYLLGNIYNIQPSTAETVRDYCRAVQAELEDDLLDLTLGADQEDRAVPALILAVRGDLERLADETLGLNNRPEGWIGNKDINSDTLARDNFADLERLADTLLGEGNRPAGWVDALVGSLVVTFRNLRFDLELLADVTLGEGLENRPRGWQGENPVFRCSQTVQNLVLLVQQTYDFDPREIDVEPEVYCAAVTQTANDLVENPPDVEDIVVDETLLYESRLAFTYLDPAATQYMGVMPQGIEFRPWYRNFGGSTMMFVSGDNFAVFIDRRWTNMPQEVFDRLPTLEGVRPLAFCDANWCNGPAPTPTPTGSGPLLEIITAATPPATVEPGQVQSEGKQLVSWNHLRVNYLLQRPEEGVTQVTLEICRTTQQVACEPVTSVYNNNTGTPVPVVDNFNGLNVYELPYGYSTDLLIEGATLFSTDIWLNDPSLSN